MNKEMEDEYWQLKTEKVVKKLQSREWDKEDERDKKERREEEDRQLRRPIIQAFHLPPIAEGEPMGMSELYKFTIGVKK